MNNSEIYQRLNLLNERLKSKNIKGELTIYGGAVMCLCFNSRESTSDIDGWFAPKKEMYDAINEVTNINNFEEGWLNDSVKGFISQKDEVIEAKELSFSNLRIFRPVDKYQFAMKCMSCRLEEDEHDIEDIMFLIKKIGIDDVEQAEDIIEEYFPKEMILPKTHFMLIEMIDKIYLNQNKEDYIER